MNRFEQTAIWQKTLGKQLEKDIFEKERDLLRVEFENIREKSKLLAGEISRILPDYTVHDINHIDALWDNAELVTQGELELSPAEGFVLGITFLIHDLGMGLASFPNGIDEVKKEALWQDTVSSIRRSRFEDVEKTIDLSSRNSAIEEFATEVTLRSLHARHAEKLALISWKDKNHKDIFLIDNADLRESYGTIIGLIAHSHWWSVEDLEDKLPAKLGAPGAFPSSWIIDPVKLACILRISDATQIDDRRAPSFLRTIRRPSTHSEQHWNFQEKLYQPRLEKNRLVYTSKSPFNINEVDSWWLCHDTLKMIDNELKDVDALLVDTNRQRLKATGVAAVEDTRRLSRLVTVDGWQPVDAKIKVTNVAKLVGNLGGEQLYGDNAIIPLRELIQNGSDAIRARRLLERERSDFGDIVVRFGSDNDGEYIEVEDNGIGMSTNVLTGPFLEFGESFWGTPLMHNELPGLEAMNFVPSGKYGIGFFSVFMWGEKVSVITRRFEKGRDSTTKLEFKNGAISRPILSKADLVETIRDGGTRIRVWLKSSAVMQSLLLSAEPQLRQITTFELLETLCPSIDCNIFLEEKKQKRRVIKANDWLTIPSVKLIKRLVGKAAHSKLEAQTRVSLSDLAKNMELVKDENGVVVARSLIYSEEHRTEERLNLRGVVTIGGLRSCSLFGLIGIFVGESIRAARDEGKPIVSNDLLSSWATRQAPLLARLNLNEVDQMQCAQVIRRCGGNTNPLKVVFHKRGTLNFEEMKHVMIETNRDHYLSVQDASIFLQERDSGPVDFFENVFWTSAGTSILLNTRSIFNFVDWPANHDFENRVHYSLNLKGLIIDALSDVWQQSIAQILTNSDQSSDEKAYSGIIGEIGDRKVTIKHLDIIKKAKRLSNESAVGKRRGVND